jgi:branched-chain amino acid aminotransferase
MKEVINVNGAISPAREAVVPVMDHGFLYGDAIYETMRTYAGATSLLDRHLGRLKRSCSRIRIAPPSPEQLIRELDRTLEAARNPESYIRVMVTRGFGDIGYEHSLSLRPGLIVIVLPLKEIPASRYAQGVSAVLGRRRRNPVDALDPAIKSCNLLNNLLAYMEAQDAGAHETILLNTDGILAEGSHTNVFLVKDGILKTPSLSCGLLSGITREVALEVARREGIPFQEGEYRREEISEADEVFITSTLQEILPVTRLDGSPVGDGRPGPLTTRLLAGYRKLVRPS